MNYDLEEFAGNCDSVTFVLFCALRSMLYQSKGKIIKY